VSLPKFNFWILGILFFVVLLRLPSLFEPHWYGDEEIYLVLGQMMRRGAVLYRDIWDNKTPILYFIYALSPTLIWAKLSATVFVLGTVFGVYKLSGRLLSAALIGILLSLPILEGNIANAELYFTLPIIFGAILVYQKRSPFLIGLLAATAFLIKVPAVVDFVGLLLAFFVIKLVDEYWSPVRDWERLLTDQIKFYLPILVGFFLPILLIFGYFFVNHALQNFLIAAFSQNASYVAVGSGALSKLSNPLFIKSIFLLAGSVLVAMAYFKRLVAKELVLLSLWFGFSLFGALLSNRPYTHYLLQIVPPTILLGVYIISHWRRYWSAGLILLAIFAWLGKMFQGAFALEPVSYYRNFFDYASERKSWEEYVNYFDARTVGVYQVANLIKEDTKPNEPIFVWGDMASIYVVADRPAATKFIQAHHLTTIDSKNYDLIIQRLLKYQPKYIVVTRPVQFPFQVLETLLMRNYKQVEVVGQMYVYKNTVSVSLPMWTPSY